MKRLALLFLLVGCGEKVTQEHKYYEVNHNTVCETFEEEAGVRVVCGEAETFIAHGLNGSFEGEIGLETVCPYIEGEHPEVLLNLNGVYMALLVHGNYKQNRLVVLEENTRYMTTDNRGVYFSIIDSNIVCEEE